MHNRNLDRIETFRRLHSAQQPLLLANAWDAGSARLIEQCGAPALATTSAGLAWSRGYADGGSLPPELLVTAVAEIARVLTVPLSVDIEDGYADEPEQVAALASALIDTGAVGINLEDGDAPPDLLCAKIEAVRKASAHAGVELFVNARTDVYLRGLAPAGQAVAETVTRAARYRQAGCDGLFVPGLADADEIREIAGSIGLPLNVMALPALPGVDALQQLGVRRVSTGSAIAQAAYGISQRAATRFLREGRYEAMFEHGADYAQLNALFTTAADN